MMHIPIFQKKKLLFFGTVDVPVAPVSLLYSTLAAHCATARL